MKAIIPTRHTQGLPLGLSTQRQRPASKTSRVILATLQVLAALVIGLSLITAFSN